jgi:alcohol oxidase
LLRGHLRRFTGGTAACVIASRLSAADPSLKILLVEAGPHTYGLQSHIQPARFLSHLAPTSKTVAFNVGRPSKNLNGRSLVIQSGRCVGGGSSVNCRPSSSFVPVTECEHWIILAVMLYTRAAASDYDDWEKTYGNPGWGSRDLISLLKKVQFVTFQVVAIP